MDFKKYLIVLVFLVVGIFIGRMIPGQNSADNSANTLRSVVSKSEEEASRVASPSPAPVSSRPPVTNTTTNNTSTSKPVQQPTVSNTQNSNVSTPSSNTTTVSPYVGIKLLSKNSFKGNIFNDVEEVKNLQKFLVASGFLVGNADGKFGPMTQLAVMKFQKANLISPIAGYVGSTTRAYINQVISDPYNANRANTAECPCSKAGYPGRWATAEDGDGDGKPACQVTSHCEMYGW